MNDSLHIAVDLGAGSGRVFLVEMSAAELLLEEAHRFHYPPLRRNGHLRWDIAQIFAEIKTGLRAAGKRARDSGRRIESIGVDGWGVDYGLIDREGNLCEDPIAYRDERTDGAMERVFVRVSRDEIFARTGIQFLVFNTLFQLYTHRESGIPESAFQLLLIPDLIHFFLTGRAATEYTNATTTQLVAARTGTWDFELLKRLGLPEHLFTPIVPAGTDLGALKPEIEGELGLAGARVIAPATHDTGSAFMGTPFKEGWACISSGTWSLVGVDLASVVINSDAARFNFTNEGGAFGRIRFLKNVMGLWLLESCRREWQEQGHRADYDSLLGAVERLEESTDLIYPDDPRFFNPSSMRSALAEQLAENGHRLSSDPAGIAQLILDSLAYRYASVLRTIESLTGGKFLGIHIVGGGSQNDYLNQKTATATGLPVMAGPVEAAATGNALVQALVRNRFKSVAEARQYLTAHVRMRHFMPRLSRLSDEATRRYAAIEARYTARIDSE